MIDWSSIRYLVIQAAEPLRQAKILASGHLENDREAAAFVGGVDEVLDNLRLLADLAGKQVPK